MLAATQKLPAAASDNVVVGALDAGPIPAKRKKPPVCTLSGKVVGPNRVDGVQLNHEPGALLAVLGDRSDQGAEVGETKECGAYALMALDGLMQLSLAGEKLVPGQPMPTQRVNAMMQQMSAFNPADELEGMIALQCVSLHWASMDSLRRGLSSTNADHRARYLGQANKCSRTFSALLEQLNRHRGKVTTQRVVVENVNVAPGAQAVVGAVATGGGGGRQDFGADQPHEQNEANYGGSARSASVFGSRAQRDALQAAGEQEQEALSPARGRARQRSAKGQPECVEARTLHGRSDSDAPPSQQDGERSAQPAGVNV